MQIFKFLWGEAVLTAVYLINGMPLRILGFKSPIQCLKGSIDYVVPPRVFGCVCFARNYRSSVGKLNPRALNVSLLIILLLRRGTSVIILLSGEWSLLWMLLFEKVKPIMEVIHQIVEHHNYFFWKSFFALLDILVSRRSIMAMMFRRSLLLG